MTATGAGSSPELAESRFRIIVFPVAEPIPVNMPPVAHDEFLEVVDLKHWQQIEKRYKE